MKHKITALVAMLFSGAFFIQPNAWWNDHASFCPSRGQHWELISSGAAGIALGNRVVMRGYVDFIFGYDDENGAGQTEAFNTSGDIDFLFDFSPLTAELHLAATTDDISLEQAFGRYAFNRDFNISFGRQLTPLGFKAA